MKKQLHFKHPSGKVAFASVGFSWPAFLLGPLWAAAKKQWLLFGLLLAAAIAINFISISFEYSKGGQFRILSVLLTVAYMLLCGFYANDWHRHFLEKQGFQVDEQHDQQS